MLIILAPSKTLDFTTKIPLHLSPQQPVFIEDAEKIASVVKGLNETSIQKVMHVSPAIALNVRAMYETWHPRGDKAALWTYRGDVYKGMKANTLDLQAVEWAESHLVIMSGLYGIVRPLDKISAYRLEMKVHLEVAGARDLYAFWGDKLAQYVAKRSGGVICVLSSEAYVNPVVKHVPKEVRVVTPMFYDKKPNGKIGVAPIYSKMMRGVMARWMIDHRIETIEGLNAFSMHGYTYDKTKSTPHALAFYREKMHPLVFD